MYEEKEPHHTLHTTKHGFRGLCSLRWKELERKECPLLRNSGVDLIRDLHG